MKKILILIIALLVNCKDKIPEEALFIVSNCFQCHHPDTSNFTAPSLPDIDAHYKSKFPKKEDYAQAMFDYLKDPKMEKSLDGAWIQRYGLMPKFLYPEEKLMGALYFFYETDFNSPNWKDLYEKIKKQKEKNKQPEKTFSELGQEIAMNAKAELGKNLLQAIQNHGTEGAIEFCNLNALSITEQIAQKNGVIIRRVSDKPRNQDNAANTEETQIIEIFKIQLKGGQKPKAITRESGELKTGYFAIETNGMCLQCHGKPEEMQPQVLEKLELIYPKDKAKGYEDGQIRGLWVIQKMEKNL
jgi:cytochrome c551/c552